MTPDRTRRPTAADQYRRLWRAGPRPDLKEFVASSPGLAADEIVDVIETDRAERWQRGDRVRAERYLADFPAVAADSEAALIIVYGEYYLRQESGDSPSLMEYLARFPQHAARLRDQVMWHQALDFGPLGEGPVDTFPVIPGLAIGDRLGRGGMCSVYHAIEIENGRDVAVKLLDPGHAHNPLRVSRFRRESASLLRMEHPNIVLAYRGGDARGLPYIVMEYCPGGTLSGYLKGRAMTPNLAGRVIRDLAAATHYSHGKGVIHRDLKPGNVLLGGPVGEPAMASLPAPNRSSRVGETPALHVTTLPFVAKLADFGLAKCRLGDESSITATRETLGTPCYMATELTTGARAADARTDVYGLGAILYELLTGRPPFIASTAMEVVRMVREEPPIAPRQINPLVPPILEAICLKCLAKEPEDRFETAGAVAESLA